jgi:heme ABC exporter ATP-binding subunit CcmA
MVHLTGVIKHFGTITALRGIDLELQRGCCLGIFGPNGAGKTTLLRILATLARPSAGTVRIAGYDAVKEGEKVRPLLGVLSHRTFLYGHLTAYENLQFYGRMFGLKKLPERITEVLHAVDLATYAHQLVGTYSRGMQQRLAIARAILHHPQLLLLDEPYTGLDYQAASRLHDLIAHLHAESCTIIMSTHDLHRGLDLYDEVAIQRRGKIVYRGLSLGTDIQEFEQLYSAYVR